MHRAPCLSVKGLRIHKAPGGNRQRIAVKRGKQANGLGHGGHQLMPERFGQPRRVAVLGRVINQMLMIEQGFETQTSQTIEAAK